jgi:DNA-binding transcriptional ArsR family regulator
MPTNTTDEGNLPPDVVADLLADDRRRRALELLEESGTLTLGTLARRIAAAETGVAPEEVPESLAAEVNEELWDEHLPKLTATDVVEFDSMRAAVSLSSGATGVREAL